MVFLVPVHELHDRLRLLVQRLDQLQRSRSPLAFAYAVVKKFGDDTAGDLAALITYYGFLSLFPLLLVLITILGIVAGSDPSLSRSIESSALSEFPVIGTDLGKNIHALHRDSVAGLVFGVAALVWGAQGGLQAGQQAMADVWNVPQTDRPGRAAQIGRSLLMLAVLAVFLVVTTATASISSFVKTVPAIGDVGSALVTLALNALLFVLAFRILTPKTVARRDLRPGAFVGGAVWTLLQYSGTLLVDHELRGSNDVYGFFGIVLGLMAWIYFGAEATMYAAELNVVRARHLWPRSLVSSSLTDADRRVYAALSRQARQHPTQHVDVAFGGEEPAEEPIEGARPGSSGVADTDPAASSSPDQASRPGPTAPRKPLD